MQREPQDLLLVNGRIWTAPPDGPEASALRVHAGRVAAVGDEAQAAAGALDARRIDLDGAFVMPGMIDAHCHLFWYGEARLRWVDLRGVSSLGELQSRLRARLSQQASVKWLLGRGFDQDRLPASRMPTAADLDAVSPDVPILIERVCGHAMVVNTPAQRLAGTTAPRGLLTEDDMGPVWKAVPVPGTEEGVEAAALACREAAANGFTGAHVIVGRAAEAEAFRELARRGELPIHVRLMSSDYDILDAPGAAESIPCRTLKLFTDGSLGAHTAALSRPYADAPETTGRLLLTPEELRRRVLRAHKNGYQVAVHAIGDAAVAQTVAAIAAAQASCPRPDARHRVEHASVTPPALVARMALLGIVAVVQPQFVISDFWTGARLGPRRAGWAYPFRRMLAAGVPMAGGTDCPVETLDPFEAIARAVARDPADQRLTPAEAITLFTRGSAYAGFQEGERGLLWPGGSADLLVLPDDPRALPPERIAALRPELTLVAGRVSHAAGRFADLAGP